MMHLPFSYKIMENSGRDYAYLSIFKSLSLEKNQLVTFLHLSTYFSFAQPLFLKYCQFSISVIPFLHFSTKQLTLRLTMISSY